MTKEEFIKKAKLKHGNKYCYDDVVISKGSDKVNIYCPQHGFFSQRASHHLAGHGCFECAKENVIGKYHSFDKDSFIKRAKEIHGDKYDYSQANFIKLNLPVKIICPIHGEFYQRAGGHLSGRGCNLCGIERRAQKETYTQEEIIKLFKEVHGNKYDYTKVVYKNYHTPVTITCLTHGDFIQSPALHVKGCGCPMCKNSMGENIIDKILKNKNISYEKQYKIKNENLFSSNIYFRVDFYLPLHNTIIEYNGEQHYKPLDIFGGKKQFEKQQERDMALRQYCNEHKIKLIEIPYTEYDNIETILEKELKFDKNKT